MSLQESSLQIYISRTLNIMEKETCMMIFLYNKEKQANGNNIKRLQKYTAKNATLKFC